MRKQNTSNNSGKEAGWGELQKEKKTQKTGSAAATAGHQ